MKILCYKEENLNRAELIDGEKVLMRNWFYCISDVYVMADKASRKYGVPVEVEFVRECKVVE